MKYAGIIKNDVVNGQKVCVSFWCQGCPHHCFGCHNQHTWDFDGGIDAKEDDLIAEIIEALKANGVERNLSILGGEPLCAENIGFTLALIHSVRSEYPDVTIFVWTGYTFEELNSTGVVDGELFHKIDVLIDGRFEIDKKSYILPLRGSSNQRVIDVNKTIDSQKIVLYEIQE